MLTFKKTIACLMSLIMIMTVTPFTAVTASAATAKSVSSNIDETNKKYHAAPSTTFTPKTGMSEVSWLNSAEVNEVSSSDGKFHKQSYAPSSNVLYWPSAYVGTTDCLQFQKNHLDFRAYYPSAVLMWDGTTDAYMPIMCIAQNTNKIDGRRVIYYAAPYDSERISNATSPAHSANFYADTWRGTKVEQNENFNGNMYGNNTPFGFEAKVLTEFISTGENANKCYSFGTDIGSRDLASFLHIDSNIDNDTSFISNGFLAKKLYWTTNSSNVDFTTAYDNNSKESSSTIYVVNYKPIVTAANEAAKDLESFDQTLYTPDAVNEYYKAIQDLYDCDPNSSFNQKDGKDVTDISDTAAKVANCANDIKNRVSAYEKAKLKLESSKQYRIKFTNSNTDLLSDNYYKAGDTIVVPVLSDSYEDCDKTGHCTVTFEWQPAVEKTASANVNYAETKIVPAKTPHTYGAYSQITQDGKNGHIRTCSECGYKDWALCDDHYVKKSSTPATCTQDEQIVYECSVCHRIKTEVGEKKKGHDYEVVSPKVDATCETPGKTEEKRCKNCGDTIGGDVIPALKHDYSILVSKKQEATCTTDGKEAEYECSKCGNHTGGEVIKATGHNYQYFEAENKIVCSKCGDEKKVGTSYIVPEGYTLVETVPPKCTEIGYTLYKNSEGKEFYNDIKSPTGHQYGKTTVVAPTCTEQGYTIYKCKNCGDTYKDDYVKALGHTEVIDEAVAPTCTQSGLTEGKHCSVCNAVLVKQEKIDALGHDFSNNAQVCLNGCGKVNPNYVAPDTSTVQMGKCGENVTYSLNTSTGVLTISGTGEMTDSPFRQNSNIIKSVIIENGVTSIVTYAFSGCTSLTSITIPDSVTSIGESAFDGCTSLVSVTLSKSITTIEYSTFFGCSSLTSIEIPKSVTTIVNFAFCGCTNLTDVYYAGTQSEWNKINIGHSNEFLTNASLHCSSTPTPEPAPTPKPTPTPNTAPQPSTQPTQESTPQQATQQTAQQPLTQNNTTAAQTEVAKPKSVSPKKVKSAKKAVSVEWKKVSGVKGYQIQVATDKKFKKNKKTVTIKKQKTTKTTVKKLKAKKKYYVRVRTYKIMNGKKVYSSWSKVKSVKTK